MVFSAAAVSPDKTRTRFYHTGPSRLLAVVVGLLLNVELSPEALAGTEITAGGDGVELSLTLHCQCVPSS